MNPIERLKKRFSRNNESRDKIRYKIKYQPKNDIVKKAPVEDDALKLLIEQDPRLVWQKITDIG